MILALDLGARTGFALDTDPVTFGAIDLSGTRFSGGGFRFVQFRRWLDETWMQYAFDEVAFEEVHRHAATAAAHAYGGYLATLQCFCEEKGIPYHSYGVGAIKKHATGQGNAKKEAMVAAAKALGFAVTDDNAADAIHILRLAKTR